MIRCRCGDAECQTAIVFDPPSAVLLFRDKHNEETVMYLDANAVVEIMAGLRTVLRALAEGEGPG